MGHRVEMDLLVYLELLVERESLVPMANQVRMADLALKAIVALMAYLDCKDHLEPRVLKATKVIEANRVFQVYPGRPRKVTRVTPDCQDRREFLVPLAVMDQLVFQALKGFQAYQVILVYLALMVQPDHQVRQDPQDSPVKMGYQAGMVPPV